LNDEAVGWRIPLQGLEKAMIDTGEREENSKRRNDEACGIEFAREGVAD
jgi:hypothetical protein